MLGAAVGRICFGRNQRAFPTISEGTFQVISADPAILANRELPQRHIHLALIPITGSALEHDTTVDFLFDDKHVVLAGGKNKWIWRRNIALADFIDEPGTFAAETPVGSYIAAYFVRPGWSLHVLTCSRFRSRCINICFRRAAF